MYSPIAFFQKYDPKGTYVKKYCPELKNYPPKLIYTPWKATESEQKAFGCIIGEDYPNPLVDHDIARQENLAKMKYNYGNQDLIISR